MLVLAMVVLVMMMLVTAVTAVTAVTVMMSAVVVTATASPPPRTLLLLSPPLPFLLDEVVQQSDHSRLVQVLHDALGARLHHVVAHDLELRRRHALCVPSVQLKHEPEGGMCVNTCTRIHICECTHVWVNKGGFGEPKLNDRPIKAMSREPHSREPHSRWLYSAVAFRSPFFAARSSQRCCRRPLWTGRSSLAARFLMPRVSLVLTSSYNPLSASCRS